MNLTIEMDADVLERARARASEEGNPVGAVLREYLGAYAGGSRSLQGAAAEEVAQRRSEAIASLIRLSRVPRAVAPPHRTTRDRRGDRNWKRDDLYGG